MSKKITIAVFCYNNLQYIYQALDSILHQTYDDIQLIVSDDGSRLFPATEIDRYIQENGKNIKSYIVRQNESNMGTVRHINKVLEYVEGEYYLGLAVDDILMEDTVIAAIMQMLNADDGQTIFVGQVGHYDEKLEEKICDSLSGEDIAVLNRGNTEELFERLCMQCFIPAPGVIYNVNVLKKTGGFNEKYKLVEDWPFYLAAVRQGIHFQYIDVMVSKHRTGGVSHSKRKKGDRKQDLYYNDLVAIMRHEIVPYADLLTANKKKIMQHVNDTLVIAEYKQKIIYEPGLKKIKWIVTQAGIIGIVWRGIMRRIRRRFKGNEW